MANEPVFIPVGDGGIALCADQSGRLKQLGFGPEASDAPPSFPVQLYPNAFPVFGDEPLGPHALRVTHGSNAVCRFSHFGSTRSSGPSSTTHRLQLVDDLANISMVVAFEVFVDHGLVATWTEVSNASANNIRLEKYASCAPLIAGAAPAVTHFGGGWAAEWTPTITKVGAGSLVLESRGGVQPHLHLSPAFLLAPDGGFTESEGTVFGAMSLWTGNNKFEFHGDINLPSNERRTVRAVIGASAEGAEITLGPHEAFTSPRVVWGWSTSGVGDLSRRFHSWISSHQVRDPDRTRSIVWNNWEATGFDFDEKRLVKMITDSADLGAELFLLDDGWFGEKFPRTSDAQGLGDWQIDRRKLPNGLEPLIDAAENAGIRFGLWFEPEMVNPRSRLFEQHPDWIVCPPGREPWQHRNQLVLDLCRPDVSDFAFAVIDDVLRAHPGISYIKWDANRPISEPFSPTLPPDRSTNFWLVWAEAVDRLMDRVALAHPDVEMMLCASGGGRVDPSALRHFHEVWPSDNTDPLFRIRMQSAMSYFFPAKVIGAHVTRWGDRPIAFACAVAMSARFGFDIDPEGLTRKERAICARASNRYKSIADVVQRGELYRLVSPFEGDRSALMFVLDGTHAVAFAYQTGERVRADVLRLEGLAEDQLFDVSPIDLLSDDPPPTMQRTGRQLAQDGLWWPLTTPETAAMWTIRPTSIAKRVIDITAD